MEMVGDGRWNHFSDRRVLVGTGIPLSWPLRQIHGPAKPSQTTDRFVEKLNLRSKFDRNNYSSIMLYTSAINLPML